MHQVVVVEEKRVLAGHTICCEQIPEREYLSNLVSGETYKRVITVNGNIVDNRVVTIN